MITKWIYILIGDDKTGKTTFQKELLKILCGINRDAKLDSARTYDINHPNSLKKVNRLFLCNRSYQEKKDNNITTVEKYFEHFFDSEADICILSSHLIKDDIKEMIKYGRMNFYNIGGVFFKNSILKSPHINKEIALLDWDERFNIDNILISDFTEEQFNIQISKLAEEFAQMLINRMCFQ